MHFLTVVCVCTHTHAREAEMCGYNVTCSFRVNQKSILFVHTHDEAQAIE